MELDLSKHTVKVSGETAQLTAIQYSLLVLFAKNEGRVLTHQYILREIWGEAYTGQLQYLRVFVAQLRKHLEGKKAEAISIKTISGIGYRFESL